MWPIGIEAGSFWNLLQSVYIYMIWIKLCKFIEKLQCMESANMKLRSWSLLTSSLVYQTDTYIQPLRILYEEVDVIGLQATGPHLYFVVFCAASRCGIRLSDSHMQSAIRWLIPGTHRCRIRHTLYCWLKRHSKQFSRKGWPICPLTWLTWHMVRANTVLFSKRRWDVQHHSHDAVSFPSIYYIRVWYLSRVPKVSHADHEQ